MTALALNGDRSAEDIIANGPSPGTLETVALMSGLAVAMAGGDAGEMVLGVNAGVNAAQNNQAAQLMALAQAAARFGQVGWSGLTAEAQVVLARCAASAWCASLPLAGAAVAYVSSAQLVGVQPTGAGAIPNGYASGQPLPPAGPTVLPVTGTEGANTTTTPGTVVDGGRAPGYEVVAPTSGGTSTATPIAAAIGPNVMMTEEDTTNAAPIGRGSTGRDVANNLSEQLAMEQAMSHPEAGIVLVLRKGMTDARWPESEGWTKMTQNINGIEIHYVRNINTGEVDDFKFK